MTSVIAKVLATSEQRPSAQQNNTSNPHRASRIRRSWVSISQRTNLGPMVPTPKLFYGDRILNGSGSIQELVAKLALMPAESLTPVGLVAESELTPLSGNLKHLHLGDFPSPPSTSIFADAIP
jgi:hypothetical protein